jgi:flagellar biogenesis protein FliO
MTRALLAALLLALAVPALAQERAPAAAAEEPGTARARALPEVASFPTPLAGTLARVLAALAAITGTGAGLAWWSRRRRGAAGGTSQRIQIVASRAIGPRHTLVLVEVGERRLLLGTAPESVRALADLTEIEPFAAQLARELPESERAERRELVGGIGSFEGLDA